jgi:hypothetical protein
MLPVRSAKGASIDESITQIGLAKIGAI